MNDTASPVPQAAFGRRNLFANWHADPTVALIAILALALLSGGGGSRFAIANLLVQLGTLIAAAFHRSAFARFWNDAPLALRGVVLMSLALPLVHVIPLPYGVWESLPGRDLVVQSRALADPAATAYGSAPLSVDPVRTLVAFTALLVPLAVLTIGWTVPRDRLVLVGWIIVAIAIMHLLLGTVQVLSNGEQGLLYPQNPMPGVLFGFFANRNSTGLFLVAALSLAVLLPPPMLLKRGAIIVRLSAVVLLLLAIALTRSRTAFVLAALPLGLATLRYYAAMLRSEKGQARQRARVLLVVGVVGAIAAALLIAVAPGRVGDTIERFDNSRTDPRAYIWDDALHTAERHWPAGSGMGTFDEVFQIDESLENMAQLRAGRAHGDYIEIVIEAGVAGLMLVAAWLILIAWLGWRARKSRGRWIAWSGAAILLAIALQSITDYPLRNLGLLAFAAFALLLLVRFGDGRRQRTRTGTHRA